MNGWAGPLRAVIYYLDVVGADRDEAGDFLIRGEVASFMGVQDAEVVVAGDAVYFSRGVSCNLAAGLRSTSGGVAVKVY